MKRNAKIKDYFAAKSRKNESSGIMDDVYMAFCLFCILRVGTDDMFYLFIISLRFGPGVREYMHQKKALGICMYSLKILTRLIC